MKEEDIRPRDIFDEYLRLAEADTKTFFSNAVREYISCPACGSKGSKAFEKHGFVYETCPDCQSLYVNPRPQAEAFNRYYEESPSSTFWATTFYKETAESRREKLWKPKAKMVAEIIKNQTDSLDSIIIDIGGGYGIFAEEIGELISNAPIIIEPGPNLASICREKGIQVVQKFLEHVIIDDLPIEPKVFVSFELFEHLHDPGFFLKNLYSLMSNRDLFIFTTLSGSGVDIQVLWEDSKSVMPPHHLNFLNPHSVSILLKRCGFETLSVTTPGKLDIDILSNNLSQVKDRFWKTFLMQASAEDKQKCQEWLSSSGYSSHMMVICRRN
jgi:hypothetical protein